MRLLLFDSGQYGSERNVGLPHPLGGAVGFRAAILALGFSTAPGWSSLSYGQQGEGIHAEARARGDLVSALQLLYSTNRTRFRHLEVWRDQPREEAHWQKVSASTS